MKPSLIATVAGLFVLCAGMTALGEAQAKTDESPKPRVSAAIDVPGSGDSAGSSKAAESSKPVPPQADASPKPRVSAAIAVPQNARAGAADRASEDTAKAAAEQEAQRAAAEGPTSVSTSSVIRAGDRRFSVTTFRRLGTFPVIRLGQSTKSAEPRKATVIASTDR